MKINIGVSDWEIRGVINTLLQARSNIEHGVEETVSILTKNAAMVAQANYGHMASVDYDNDETTGIIATKADRANIIAEFGAGDATLDPLDLFENDAKTPVYPGSYSELEGSGEYAETGKWHFGGRTYTEIEPRLGLFEAKQYLLNEGAQIAEEVIQL